MDEDGWKKVKEVFLAALETDAAGRAAFLDEQCAGDDALRDEVESLLATHAEVDDFIEEPAFRPAELFIGEPLNPIKQFGNYRIVGEIGTGGMGAVFLAERSDGEFDRRVAVKIIRQQIAEGEMIGRFKRERQILASLNHPNIAKLIDGGLAADGSPFLAMEYIEGETITAYANRENLSLERRLRLFLKVCAAVAYAHRNLVVHRDIKPSNILVTADGEPKLLDFGLAKLLGDDLQNESDRTQTAFRAMTPAFASPEQLTNAPITTASDIYSLGVVLYELLTGARPFQFDGKSLDEIVKLVTTAGPPPPSSVANSAIANPKALRGDLDNIVLTALRKEPENRFESVEAFAADVGRYLDGLPVAARPLTFAYRASKFVRRHTIGVVASSLIALSLVGGLVASLWQARIAGREKEKAEKINEFLKQTLRYSNPITNNPRKNGRETTVSELLDESARRLESGEFDNYPEVKAELELTVATIYFGQGKYIPARKHMEQYVILLRGIYGETHPKMVAASMEWAQLLFDKGELDEAEKTYRKFLPLLRKEHRAGNVDLLALPEALNNFAYLRRTQGDSAEAESLFRETLTLIPSLSEEDRRAVTTTRSTLASTLADQGKFAEALETANDAVREYRDRGETSSPGYGFALTIDGGFLVEQGEFEMADANLKEAEKIFREMVSGSSLWIGDNLRNQSGSLYAQGRYAEAIAKADEALKIYEENFGVHYDNYPTALIYKGLSLARSGRASDGEKLLREAVKIRTESLPAGHFWVALAKSALGECLALENRAPEALPLLTESYESLKRTQGDQNPRTVLAQKRLATITAKKEELSTDERR